MKTGSPIGTIILAAGASRRFGGGQMKQSLEFENVSLLRRAAETALAVRCLPATVVLGANAERLIGEIEDLPVAIVVSELWARGMSESIKAGLTALEKNQTPVAAVLMTLCDQPLIAVETLGRLVRAFRQSEKPIVASRFEDTIGVPAIFAEMFFERLKNLSGDAGAKQIIRQFSDAVETVFVPEAAADVDTWDDYRKLVGQ